MSLRPQAVLDVTTLPQSMYGAASHYLLRKTWKGVSPGTDCKTLHLPAYQMNVIVIKKWCLCVALPLKYIIIMWKWDLVQPHHLWVLFSLQSSRDYNISPVYHFRDLNFSIKGGDIADLTAFSSCIPEPISSFSHVQFNAWRLSTALSFHRDLCKAFPL